MHSELQTKMLDRLREHLANGTTDLAPYNLRVPASHYTSDNQNKQEIEIMFKQRPLLVALSPQFPEVGDYLTHVAVETNLLLVLSYTVTEKNGKVKSRRDGKLREKRASTTKIGS